MDSFILSNILCMFFEESFFTAVENWVFLSQRCNSMQEESMFKSFKSNCIALLSQLPIPLANPPFTGESPTFANA